MRKVSLLSGLLVMGLAAVTAVEAADGPKPAHFRVRPDSENGCYPVGGKAIVEIAIEEEGRRPDKY